MRALPTLTDFSSLYPVTPIVLDSTTDSMLYKTQNAKFLQVQSLATKSKQIL